jgi:hypothetical protein
VNGNRRRIDYVVARSIARAVAVGLIFCSLGNMLALGCAFAWLQHSGSAPAALWMVAAAALAQFAGGAAALVAYGWSR